MSGRTLDAKLERLRAILLPMQRVLVAFSGGVDSTFVYRYALHCLGPEAVTSVTFDTPAMARSEIADAVRLAAAIGGRFFLEPLDIFANPGFVRNEKDRCYFCKFTEFGAAVTKARSLGIDHVLDGTNADDLSDYRPGGLARKELGVRSPLHEAMLTKSEIREASARFGLPTADKPATACLSSRVPYGTPITTAILDKIERAEAILRDAGFVDIRVRYHDTIARIEVEREAIPRFASEEGLRIAEAIRGIGFLYVVVDIEGFRSGSMNRAIGINERQ